MVPAEKKLWTNDKHQTHQKSEILTDIIKDEWLWLMTSLWLFTSAKLQIDFPWLKLQSIQNKPVGGSFPINITSLNCSFSSLYGKSDSNYSKIICSKLLHNLKLLPSKSSLNTLLTVHEKPLLKIIGNLIHFERKQIKKGRSRRESGQGQTPDLFRQTFFFSWNRFTDEILGKIKSPPPKKEKEIKPEQTERDSAQNINIPAGLRSRERKGGKRRQA